MEPLTFKIITDADDSGVRRYEKSLSGVDVTGRKASSAIKGFVGDLQNAQNVSDVTSSALNALTKILGTSLAATGVVVVGKLLVDAFNKVNDAVKESTKSVESANKQISKIAMAGNSFETASRSAEILNKTADDLRKNLEKINESKLQSFIAGLTGAKEKMEELVTTTTKQAQEQQRQAIVQKLIELERNATLDETTKKIAEQQKPYQELVVLVRELGDEELMRAVEAASQAAARKTQSEEQAKLDLKLIEDRKKAEEERIKEKQKLEEEAAKLSLKILDAEEKARADAYKIEKAFQQELIQKDQERLRAIEKTIAGIEARKKALQEELATIQAINAAEAGRSGGTGRGPEQRPSSFEIGMDAANFRAELKAMSEAAKATRESIREELRARGENSSNYDIDREIIKRTTEERKKAAKELVEKEKELKKEIESLKKEAEELSKEQKELTKSLEKAKETLDDWAKSLLDFVKDFEIPGKNMIDDFLKAGEGANNLGEAGNMVASALSAASAAGGSALSSLGDAASSAASKLQSLLPSAGEKGAGENLATEATLKEVLSELRDNLEELRSYAHAT